MIFRDREKTLEDVAANHLRDKILKQLNDKFGITLRQA